MPILPVLLGGRPLNGVGSLYHDGAIALLLSFYLRGVHEKVLEFAFYGRSGSLARPAILPAVGDLRNTANKNGNLFPRFIFCLTLKVLMHRHFATLR